MMRHRWISMIVVTVVLTALVSELTGATALAGPGSRSAVVITPRVDACHRSGPAYRRAVIIGPRHRRFIRLGPPRPQPVIVPRPVTKHIVIDPLPTITVTVPVQPTTLTLWVTNSNGSRISVQLVKDGPWYVGPRGEYYTSIPTNEQLRVVYGF